MKCISLSKIVLVFLLCLFAYNGHAKTRTFMIRVAMARKIIMVHATAKGTTGRNALRLEITNNTADTFSIKTESGLMFQCEDPMRQPLVLLGGDDLVLHAHEKKSIDVTAFCGNSRAYCPVAGANYNYTKQLDTNLVSILRYARSNDIPLNLAQAVVWTFTNGHPVSAIYTPQDPNVSKDFAKYVSAKLKRDMPHYFINYRIDSSGFGPMVRHGDERVFVNVNWRADQGYRNVYVSIYKADGTFYRRVENNIVIDKYGSTAVVEFFSARDPAGKYKVRVHDDANNTLQEEIVQLGADQMMH